ncbi:MAG: Ig-like domain-containing protein [Myxococcota bacterium]
MKQRGRCAVPLALAAALSLGGCWEVSGTCPYGTWPVDGATGVPLDAVIDLHASSPLPADTPNLARAVSLTTADGASIPVDVEVRGATVRLIPRRGLEPDTDYTAWGVDPDAARSGQWWGDLENSAAAVVFSTGGQPVVQSVAQLDDGIAVMAFSEPVDLDSLVGAVHAAPGVAVTVLGTDDRADTLVELQLDPVPDVPRLRLTEGATTLDGRPVAPSGGWIRVHRYADQLVTTHRGEPACY